MEGKIINLIERMDNWGHEHNLPNAIQAQICWLLDWSVKLLFEPTERKQ